MLKTFILLMLIAVGGYCDIFAEVGDFFTKHFTDVKSLFASDEKELQQGLNRVRDLLTAVQEKLPLLKPLANEGQLKILNKIGNLLSQVNDFQRNVFNSKMEFNQKENNWENLVKKIFVSEGVSKIIPLVQQLLNSAPATFATYLLTFVVPFLINALRE
ncbi:unnamed protein product [Cercopithifilaria johnstoni]|uniref:Uncharacterized protein n=1 Tax=Cercopithifilaria johnstoni TaxID=2874296 RepID=A0A8J2PXU4_9BILA|nr:unnamed protein product [Cercopithifilaria johnstoni]